MTMSGALMASSITSKFASAGFVGVNVPTFSSAYGLGSIEGHLLGKTFTTTDTGTIAGSGVGTGIGITGVSSSTMSTAMFDALVTALGGSGPDLPTVTDALSESLVEQLLLATLTSSHTPVHIGSGIVDIGSIAVAGGAWGTSVENLGIGSGFLGDDWPDFASEAATAMADSIVASGTGTVTIVGGGTSAGAGSGVGTGVLS